LTRLYATPAGAETTVNARWTGTNWTTDDLSMDSTRTMVTGIAGTIMERRPAGAGTWTAWPSPPLTFSPIVHPSSTSVANAITANNIIKAWAIVETDGSGAATVIEGFNVTSATISGANVLVTIGANMIGDYGVWTTDMGGSFQVNRRDLANNAASLSLATTAALFFVAVVGKQ
jgi:hypothetical protein